LPHDYWFELGILNYGMSTATTAQGLMLLRIVDKDLESGAAEDYALAAPLSAPFIGGGIVTLSLPALLENLEPPRIMIMLVILLCALSVLGFWLARRDRTPA
jgi:ESS family glutamate:Na+ symporter